MIIGFDIFYNFTESSLMTSSVDLVWAGLNSDITSIFPQLDFQNEKTRETGMYRLFSLLLEFKGTVFQLKITFTWPLVNESPQKDKADSLSTLNQYTDLKFLMRGKAVQILETI